MISSGIDEMKKGDNILGRDSFEGATLEKTVKTELWLAGDLLFLLVAQGRECASGHWCVYCDLVREQ